MLVDVAGVAHVNDTRREHQIDYLLQVAPRLWLDLHVHFGRAIGVELAVDAHSFADFFAFFASQELVDGFITVGLFFESLKVIRCLILDES